MTSNLYSPWKQHVLHIYADFMAENRLNGVACDDIYPAWNDTGLFWQEGVEEVAEQGLVRNVYLYIMLAVYQQSTHLHFKKMHILIVLTIYIYRTLRIKETCLYLAVAGTLVSIFALCYELSDVWHARSAFGTRHVFWRQQRSRVNVSHSRLKRCRTGSSRLYCLQYNDAAS